MTLSRGEERKFELNSIDSIGRRRRRRGRGRSSGSGTGTSKKVLRIRDESSSFIVIFIQLPE
jgi:hypothetical protein